MRQIGNPLSDDAVPCYSQRMVVTGGWVRSLFVVAGLALSGCGSRSVGCELGEERCECYGNDSCNDGLSCRSNLCVSSSTKSSGDNASDAGAEASGDSTGGNGVSSDGVSSAGAEPASGSGGNGDQSGDSVAAAGTDLNASTGGADDSDADGDGSNDSASNNNAAAAPTAARMDVDKIDLLFVIDNSVSMADKQKILALAMPQLVDRLVSPICVDGNGFQVDHPASADAECAFGTREFKSINDIHIGVITTSLGAYGAPIDCTNDPVKAQSVQTVDMAHLLGSLPRGGGSSPGFLTWSTGRSDHDALVAEFANQVAAAGEFGCGWEASLESWYRFLIEPYPYTKVVRQNCPFGGDTNKSCIGPETNADGQVLVDQVILSQRRQFLRADSLLTIVMLSDENDCSFRASGQSWRLAQALNDGQPRTINQAFRGTSACETDTNDECCHSCGAAPPSGCQAEQNESGQGVGLGCASERKYPLATASEPSEDAINLRCFQQKRRFGVDYLYPVERYSNALSLPVICPFADDLDPSSEPCSTAENGDASPTVVNPIFDDLGFEERVAADPDSERAPQRAASRVLLAGIVGVPWQDLAQNVDGAFQPDAPLRYRVAAETDNDADERINWQWLVGDQEPPAGIPNPSDPMMIESIEARTNGVNPVTGEGPAAPGSLDPNANSINGHEWNIVNRNDLQYACTFPVENKTCITREQDQERRLAGEAVPNCDCTDYAEALHNNPLCQTATGEYGFEQYAAKAYPSIRQLQVLREFGDNAVVASICPKETTDSTAQDFGYRPAISAIIERMKTQLPD